MTNKKTLIEFIWLFISYTLACTLIFMLMSLFQQHTFYLSDIYIGSRVSESSFSFANFFNVTTVSLGFLLLLPTLFIINLIRGAFKKFKNRGDNIYLMFVTLLSMLLTAIITSLLIKVIDFLTKGLPFYPSIVSAPEVSGIKDGTGLVFYTLLSFFVLQLLSLIFLSVSVFRQKKLAD